MLCLLLIVSGNNSRHITQKLSKALTNRGLVQETDPKSRKYLFFLSLFWLCFQFLMLNLDMFGPLA